MRYRNILLVVALTMIQACEYGHQTRAWTEDVLLDDGTTITVARYVSFDATNSLAGDAYSATETQAKISFTGELKSLPAWDDPLMPVVLYHDSATGEWVVVAASSRCEVWRKRGEPLPPYWEFHLTPTGWRERPVSSASIGKAANLFTGYTGRKESSHLGVEDKRTLDRQRGVAEKYRRVVASVREGYCGSAVKRN